MRILIIGFVALVLGSCETNTKEPSIVKSTLLPPTFSYKILSEKSDDALSKCNIDIQISEKINEAQITEIANDIRQTRPQYRKLWIFYYTPNMIIGSGAWATSHFTPELKVEILGGTADQEKASNELSKKVDGEIKGKWYEQQYTSSSYVLYKKKNKTLLKQLFGNGQVLESEILERRVKDGLMLNYSGDEMNGEYFIVNNNGDLDFYNREGTLFTSGKRVN